MDSANVHKSLVLDLGNLRVTSGMKEHTFPSCPMLAEHWVRRRKAGTQPTLRIRSSPAVSGSTCHTRETLPDHDIRDQGGPHRLCRAGRQPLQRPDATKVTRPKAAILTTGAVADGHNATSKAAWLHLRNCPRRNPPWAPRQMLPTAHEIANVLGLEGVRMMHDEGLECSPVNISRQMPSCGALRPRPRDHRL